MVGAPAMDGPRCLDREDHEQDERHFEPRDTRTSRHADSELDAVTCGAAPKLSDAACKGTHIPNVTIELF